jgi:hypothetical protein
VPEPGLPDLPELPDVPLVTEPPVALLASRGASSEHPDASNAAAQQNEVRARGTCLVVQRLAD